MADGTFATAINCMDGRTQEPVTNWLKNKFGVDYVDAITEPGADKAVTEGPDWQVESIKRRVMISVEGHGSKVIAVVGHHACAGYPVEKEQHLSSIKRAVDVLQSWKLPVRVIGLWVGDTWTAEVVVDTGDN